MEGRLLSIIIPVYNACEYLEQCLETVIHQTYKNIELILIDDGSSDGSEKICDRFSENDCKVKVFHTKNGGAVRARKLGLEMAHGEYIGFVDADDYIALDMYEKMVELLDRYDADFAASNYYEVRDGFIKKVDSLGNEEIIIYDQKKRKYEFSNYYFYGTHMIPYGLVLKVYKREFILECFSLIPEDQQYGEDSLVLMWMLIKARKFVTTNDAYYYYRILDKSLSHFETSEVFENEFRLSECRLEIVEGNRDVIDEKAFWEFTGKKLQIAYEGRSRAKQTTAKYHYYYGNINELYGKKVIVYGAGKVGYDYCLQLNESDIEIVFAADLNAKSREFFFPCNVVEPREIVTVLYDVVVIAIQNQMIANEARQQMMDIGVPEGKILWTAPKLL